MTITTENTGDARHHDGDEAGDRRTIAFARLAIGLVQGIVLYLLLRASEGEGATWSQRHPELFTPAVLVALFLPAVLLSGVGKLRLAVYAVWSLVAGAALALLAWHDVTRQAGEGREATFPLFAFAAAALFIAHHLIVPADRERRLIASFPAYFDAAWMAGVQLVLSIAFAGAFWLLLFLGAALFNVIGLSFLGDLLEQGWFSLPLTGLAFATAVQLTDVRDGLIRGVRTVALMLLSWLLLVLTVLVGAFLSALPFTGLTGLWATGSATALVLSAAGVLIILINAAYQDGRPDTRPAPVLRVAVRVASLLLTPLVLIAAWGLYLRINQHGLTPDRIIAIACAFVGAAHAAGYGFAALRTFWSKGDWMRALERTNIVTAFGVVGVILALFTPLSDPARLSVADQVSRLERGRVAPDAFDYAFLAFDSGKAGRVALAALAASTDPQIARRATEAMDAPDRSALQPAAPVSTRTPVIAVWPAGATHPQGFVRPVVEDDPRATCRAADDCLATALDLNGDGTVEVLLARAWDISLFARRPDGWTHEGAWSRPRCTGVDPVDPREAVRRGLITPRSSPWPDIDAGDRVTGRFQPAGDGCPPNPEPAPR